MNKHHFFWLALFALATLFAPLNAGETAYIVLGEHASPTAKFAARELRDALSRCVGIQTEIRDDRQNLPEQGKVFIVGPGRFCTLPEAMAYDHFIFARQGRITVLAGRDDGQEPLANYYRARTGTLYAVYRYMYERLGIRMVWPGPSGEIYPRGPFPTSDFDLSGGPKLPVRSAYYGYGGRHSELSLRRAVRWGRFNGMGCSLTGSVGHASTEAIGLERFQTHPEYYALRNGVRVKPVGNRWKLCHANADLPGLFAAWGIAHPEYKDYFPVSANDSAGWCECGACRKLDAGQQSAFHDEICVSGRMFTLANRVAREVAARHSSKQVAIYAYSSYLDPPQNIAKLDERIILFIAHGISWNAAPSEQKKFKALFDAWSGKTGKLVLRDYRNNLLPMTLFPYPRLAFRTIRYLKERFPGFMGINLCGDDTRATALWGPTGYVYARLLWNPDAELEPILSDFYQSAWPKVHRSMRRYFDYFEARAAAEIAREDRCYWPWHGGDDILTAWRIAAPEAVAKGRTLLAEARREAAGDPVELSRIDFVAKGLDAVELDRAYYDALMRVASFSGSLGNMPKHPEPSPSADRRELLAHAIRAIDARRKFMRENTDHEGIPSVLLALDRLRFMEQWESTVRNLHTLYGESDLRILLADGWRFAVDPEDAGTKKQWFSPTLDDRSWRWLRTDAPWEKQGFPGYDGAAWYRRRIEVPARWQNWPVEMVLGAVDESFDFWLDGRLLQSFRFDPAKDPGAWKKERRIPLGKLKPGPHHVAVRVHDAGGSGGIWKMALLSVDPPDLLFGKGLARPDKAVVKTHGFFQPGRGGNGRFSARAEVTPGWKYVLRAVFSCPEKRMFYKIPVAVKARCQDASGRNIGELFQIGLRRSDLKPGTRQILELTFVAPGKSVSVDCTLYFRVPKFAVESFELRPF